MKTIKILAVNNKNNIGSGYHRILMPMKALDGKKIKILEEEAEIKVDFYQFGNEELLKAEMLNGYDILYYHWSLPNSLGELGYIKQQIGIKIIGDIDDLWILPSNHPQKGNGYDHVPLLGTLADCLTVSTGRLGAHLLNFNELIKISPNWLPLGEGQFVEKNKENNDKIAIGIIGSITGHYPDWSSEMFRNTIKKLAGDREIQLKCKFVIGGYVQDKLWDKIVRMMRVNKQMETEVYGARDAEDYMTLFDKCDIILQPLEDNEFNRCKSPLRLHECGVKKIPVVGSKLYSEKQEGGAVIVAESPKQYYDAIRWLIKDENYKKVGERFREAISGCRFEDRIEGIREIVEAVVNNVAPEPELPGNVNIFQIAFDEGQSTEYTKYFNQTKEKAWRFEYGPMINIVENNISEMQEDDYLGIFSWKFCLKSGVPKKILTRILNDMNKNRETPDFVNLSRNYFGNSYMIWSDKEHPGLLDLLDKVCNKLGLQIPHNGFVTYSQMYLMKKKYYVDYINNYIKPALDYMENEIWEEVNKDAGYKSGLSKEKLKEYTGLEFYNFVTFILERLIICYVSHKNLTIKQLL